MHVVDVSGVSENPGVRTEVSCVLCHTVVGEPLLGRRVLGAFTFRRCREGIILELNANVDSSVE